MNEWSIYCVYALGIYHEFANKIERKQECVTAVLDGNTLSGQGTFNISDFFPASRLVANQIHTEQGLFLIAANIELKLTFPVNRLSEQLWDLLPEMRDSVMKKKKVEHCKLKQGKLF